MDEFPLLPERGILRKGVLYRVPAPPRGPKREHDPETLAIIQRGREMGLALGDQQFSQIVENIKNGTTLFGIDQQPFLQGYGAVLYLTLLLRQNIAPALPVSATGPGFVDLGNVAIAEALAGEYR